MYPRGRRSHCKRNRVHWRREERAVRDKVDALRVLCLLWGTELAPWPVQTHVLLASVEGMAPKKAQAAKAAKEAAEAAPVPEGEQPAAAPKEANPQAPKEAAKQPAAEAPKEAAKQPAAAAAPEQAAAPKEGQPQALEEAT